MTPTLKRFRLNVASRGFCRRASTANIGSRFSWIAVTETVKDSFAVEARCFVAQWDRLKLPARTSFGDIPDAEVVRPVIQQAEWIFFQNDNPLGISPTSTCG